MKYYIIPNTEIVMTIESDSREEAMSDFAWRMSSDMNEYFRAVTEDEYLNYKIEKNVDEAHSQFINWAHDVLEEDFYEYRFDQETIDDLAEDAWDINCDGDGYTEYECIKEAISRYEREV